MLDFNQFQVLTFDCYGTLVDWETGILDVLRPLLAERGVAADNNQILETYARTEAAIESGPYKPYRAVLAQATANIAAQFGLSLEPQEFTILAESIVNWPPFDDTVDALRKLKSKYKLAVVSNVDDDLLEGTVKKLQVEFDYTITAGQVGAYKPSLKMFEAAVEKIDDPKEAVLHVAQSLYHDHVPAKQFGLSTVWINRRLGLAGYGATPPAAATPDAEFPDLASLVQAIGL